MMSPYLVDAILGKILKGTDFTTHPVYVSLHTGDPGADGSNEVAGGSYARLTGSGWEFDGPDPGETNSDTMFFDDMPACTVTHLGIWDDPAAGNFLWGGPLTDSVELAAAQKFELPQLKANFKFIACGMSEDSPSILIGLNLSSYIQGAILEKIFSGIDFASSPIWVSLHSGVPDDIGSNEVVGGAYARQTIAEANWTAVSMAGSDSAAALLFSNLPAGTIDHIGLWDSETAGNFLVASPIEELAAGNGDSLAFASGGITVIFGCELRA